MDILEVKQHIKNKQLLPFYCFTGEETGIMRICINKMAECINAELVFADTVADILYSSMNTSLITGRKIFVIRDDLEFLKHEDVWSDFTDGKMQKNNILILTLQALDKRSKFYKTYESTITEFKRLNSSILSTYLKHEINLSEQNTKSLIEICENDYSRMLLEADKIKNYSDVENVDNDTAFIKLVNDGTINRPPQDAIFSFVDAVLRHQVNRAYELLMDCYAIGESRLALLSVLYTNAKQMLQVQSCPSGADVSKTTGLTGWQIKCAREKIGFYKIGDLVYIMRIIQNTEKGIKQGRIEEEVSVDCVLANIL